MTTKQKAALQHLIETGGKSTTAEAMRVAGYSEASIKNPQKLKRAFSTVLDQVDDGMLLDELMAIAASSDNRAKLQAIDMLLKLKDRYPAGKLKVQAFNEELERVQIQQQTLAAPPLEAIESRSIEGIESIEA